RVGGTSKASSMMRFQSVTSSALAVPARANKDRKQKATLRRIVPPLSRTHLVFAGIRTWLQCARRKKTQAPVGSKGVLNGGLKPRSTARWLIFGAAFTFLSHRARRRGLERTACKRLFLAFCNTLPGGDQQNAAGPDRTPEIPKVPGDSLSWPAKP